MPSRKVSLQMLTHSTVKCSKIAGLSFFFLAVSIIYSNLIAYLPNFTRDHFPSLSQTSISIIISIYELGGILAILLNQKILNYIP